MAVASPEARHHLRARGPPGVLQPTPTARPGSTCGWPRAPSSYARNRSPHSLPAPTSCPCRRWLKRASSPDFQTQARAPARRSPACREDGAARGSHAAFVMPDTRAPSAQLLQGKFWSSPPRRARAFVCRPANQSRPFLGLNTRPERK